MVPFPFASTRAAYTDGMSSISNLLYDVPLGSDKMPIAECTATDLYKEHANIKDLISRAQSVPSQVKIGDLFKETKSFQSLLEEIDESMERIKRFFP